MKNWNESEAEIEFDGFMMTESLMMLKFERAAHQICMNFNIELWKITSVCEHQNRLTQQQRSWWVTEMIAAIFSRFVFAATRNLKIILDFKKFFFVVGGKFETGNENSERILHFSGVGFAFKSSNVATWKISSKWIHLLICLPLLGQKFIWNTKTSNAQIISVLLSRQAWKKIKLFN